MRRSLSGGIRTGPYISPILGQRDPMLLCQILLAPVKSLCVCVFCAKLTFGLSRKRTDVTSLVFIDCMHVMLHVQLERKILEANSFLHSFPNHIGL